MICFFAQSIYMIEMCKISCCGCENIEYENRINESISFIDTSQRILRDAAYTTVFTSTPVFARFVFSPIIRPSTVFVYPHMQAANKKCNCIRAKKLRRVVMTPEYFFAISGIVIVNLTWLKFAKMWKFISYTYIYVCIREAFCDFCHTFAQINQPPQCNSNNDSTAI